MKIILVKDKKEVYPSHFVPLLFSEGRYYLGGGINAKAVVVKDSITVNKVMREVKKQMFGINLVHSTRELEECR